MNAKAVASAGLACLALAGCAPTLLTAHGHERSGCPWRTQGAVVFCGDERVAVVECHAPESGSCRALSVRYADGERAWLYRPSGFDPERPAEFRPPDKVDVLRAYRVELAPDGRRVWFQERGVMTGLDWRLYEVTSGALRSTGGRGPRP